MIKHHHRNSPPRYKFGGSCHSHYSKYRYGGSGIFSNLIGKRLIQDNIKHLINTTSKSKFAQKATDAVLEGAVNAVKTQTQKGLEHLTSTLANKSKKKKGLKKRSESQGEIINTLIHKLSDSIPRNSSIVDINGKGIVYD